MEQSFICTLPIELIQIITTYLEVIDVQNLRLTCRDLEAKIMNVFGCRAFKNRTTDLSVRSLSRINAFCRQDKFNHYVEDMAIARGKSMGEDLIWERESWGLVRFPVDIPAIQRLVDDLKYSLVNCRSFKIISRYPEAPAKPDRISVSDGLAIFLAMLARCQLDIKTFRIWFQNNSGRNIPINMSRVPIAIFQRPILKASWQHLRRLDLQLYLTRESAPLAMDLIVNATNLETLVLNLTGNTSPAGFVHELAYMDPLPPIRDLRLSYIRFDGDSLVTLLNRLGGTLHSLFLNQIHDMKSSEEEWKSLCKRLRSSLRCLEKLTVCHFRMMERLSPRLVSFPGLQDRSFTESDVIKNSVLENRHVRDDLGAVTGFRYEGPAARKMFGYLLDVRYHDPDLVIDTDLHIAMPYM